MHMAFPCLTCLTLVPSLTVSTSHHLTVSPSHCLTVSPSHCLTGSMTVYFFYNHLVSNILSHCLSGSITTSLYPCSIILYTYGLPLSHLSHPSPLSHCLTVSLSHCLTVSLSHRLTVSPSHFLTISPSHCLTGSITVYFFYNFGSWITG